MRFFRRALNSSEDQFDRQKKYEMNQINRSFEPLYGKPCWGVQRGYGSFLTMEFGRPHLQTREPQVALTHLSRRVRASLARRLAIVHGDWHLWIYCCDWVVRHGAKVIGDSSSARRIDRAVVFLNGQKLSSVGFRGQGASTLFRFDLGGELETNPFDRKSEQWLLYEPSGMVLVLRADRRLSYANGQTRPDAERWRKLVV